MWQKATALDQRAPGAAIQIDALNNVTLGVDKVDAFGWVVDGQSVWPVKFRITDDTLAATAVDVGAFDFGARTAARTGAPVGPDDHRPFWVDYNIAWPTHVTMKKNMAIIAIEIAELDPRGARIGPNHIIVYPVHTETGGRHQAGQHDRFDDLAAAIDGGSVDVAHVNRVLRDVRIVQPTFFAFLKKVVHS